MAGIRVFSESWLRGKIIFIHDSNIHEGNQKVPAGGKKDLAYGVSVTDACISWEDSVVALTKLSDAIKGRRVEV
jgi:phospho-2-dehydro-3-deoxyheptonate aldolase